jgi:hypothetical protein
MTMSKNAMAGAVTLCGVGLCMIGGAVMMQSGGQAHAAGGVMPAAAALVSAANAQAGPTVVWYGVHGGSSGSSGVSSYVFRAWSDGTIETKRLGTFDSIYNCSSTAVCAGPWILVSAPNDGYRATADINADELVDGVDLASVLGNWGDAPRVPFPPSDCPLNLINP